MGLGRLLRPFRVLPRGAHLLEDLGGGQAHHRQLLSDVPLRQPAAPERLRGHGGRLGAQLLRGAGGQSKGGAEERGGALGAREEGRIWEEGDL